MSLDFFNWVTMIEVPIFFALFRMIVRYRNKAEEDNADIKGSYEQRISLCKDALSEFKIHVARNYVSNNYLKDVENRLTEHLLRIEKKLDETGRKK